MMNINNGKIILRKNTKKIKSDQQVRAHRALDPSESFGGSSPDHQCWGKWPERSRTRAERSATTSRSVFRSCHSNLVPRSEIVLYRSGNRGGIGKTPEQGRNGEGGWAKVV